jgi:hypothetical protein
MHGWLARPFKSCVERQEQNDPALGQKMRPIETVALERIRRAFGKLNQLGFGLERDTDFDFAYAAQRFRPGTLHKVFALWPTYR